MPPTLAQMELLSGEELKAGIIETIIKESPVLMGLLPFKEVGGTAHAYNFELTMAQAGYYAPNEVWVEGTGTWEKRTTALTILGGDADVDKFGTTTLGNKQDISTPVIKDKAKAVQHAYEYSFLYGLTTVQTQANEFKGLLRYIGECESSSATDLDAPNNPQVLAMGAASTVLTLPYLDELIDMVKPGAPDVIIMSKRLRRKVSALARASGSALVESHAEFGKFIAYYNTIPIMTSDFILDNIQDGASSILDITNYDRSKTRASGYDNSIILAVQFGDNAIQGLQAGGGVQTEYLGTVQDKDAERTRIKWYTGLVMESLTKAAVMINVQDVAL